MAKKRYVYEADLRTVVSWAVAQGIREREVRDAVLRLGRLVVPRTPEPALIPISIPAHYVDWGENKIRVIKAYRAVSGAGLKEAKEWVEDCPQVVSDAMVATVLFNAGATIEPMLPMAEGVAE